MKFKLLSLVFVAVSSLFSVLNAQKTIVDIAVGSKDHTTLVAAVTAAD